MVYLLGKTKDILRIESENPDKYFIFNPVEYDWESNQLWLDMIFHKRILIVSSDISGTFKRELDYLKMKGRTDFEYLNDNIKHCLLQYLL